MSFSEFHNIAAEIVPVSAGAAGAQTAGALSAVTGEVIIDREAHNMPLSAVLLIIWQATLVSTHTFSLAYEVDHGEAANLSDTASLASDTAAVVCTGIVAGTAQDGVLAIPLDLGGAKRYLRVTVTPTTSAGSADTVIFAAAFILGGASLVPAV